MPAIFQSLFPPSSPRLNSFIIRCTSLYLLFLTDKNDLKILWSPINNSPSFTEKHVNLITKHVCITKKTTLKRDNRGLRSFRIAKTTKVTELLSRNLKKKIVHA